MANVMKEVANLLGLELEEEFNIDRGRNIYKLTDYGLVYRNYNQYRWKHSERFERLMLGYYEITKIPKPILDEKEKEYLSNVIKPFRNRIAYIMKCEDFTGEYIEIDLKDYCDEIPDIVMFPYFKKGTMYKGMEVNKEYTLEELGL